jgi:CDP-glycerol glycerophosphotransferase (TagB/SpsB family)
VSVRLQARNLRRYSMVPLYPVVLPIAYAWRRRSRLWVFGYVQGYRDNPRYLFEHVVATCADRVRAVWLAQTEAEASSVRSAGYEAIAKRSPQGWLMQLRAGVMVLGSGPSDLNRPLVGRGAMVQLWHGAPFKRIHADFPEGDQLLPGSGALVGRVNEVVRRATNRSRSRVSLIPSQSELVAARYQSAFQVGPGVTPVIGTPRADVINASGPEADAEALDVRRSLLPPRLARVGRLVLYAPTWRDGSGERFLAEGFDPAALDRLLERHDAALLIRLHPQGEQDMFDGADEVGTGRVVLNRGQHADVNVLMRAVDVLNTDKSALSLYYAHLRRPIVYFMPDLADYEAGRGMYESPSLLTGGLECATWPEVLDALDQVLGGDPGPYTAATEDVARRYFAHRDAESCARITEELLRRCGLV